MPETNKKAWIVQERISCHQGIFDEVNEAEHFAIRILKEPNKGKLHPATKIIVVVGTSEQAEHIRQNCLNMVQETNSRIDELLNQNAPRYKIKYKISLIKADGDVFLSVREAQSRKVVPGKSVIEALESFIDKLDGNQKDDKERIEIIRKDISLLNPNQKYTWAKHTGSNYRVTYFDSEQSKRLQTNVGHILLVVGDEQTKIQDALERKERTDRKKPLFTLNLPIQGMISVYP